MLPDCAWVMDSRLCVKLQSLRESRLGQEDATKTQNPFKKATPPDRRPISLLFGKLKEC